MAECSPGSRRKPLTTPSSIVNAGIGEGGDREAVIADGRVSAAGPYSAASVVEHGGLSAALGTDNGDKFPVFKL